MLKRDFWSRIAMDAEGGSGGGEAAISDAGSVAKNATSSPESVLFPNDAKPAEKSADPPAGDKKPDAEGDKKPDGEKPDGEKKPDEKKEGEGGEKKEGEGEKKPDADPLDQVPEDGKYELKMPDGIPPDTKLATELSGEFKAAGLTRKQAQALTDKYATVMKERAEESARDWSATNEKWITTAKADGEIGGTKWDGSVSTAQRALAKFGTPALNDFLARSGGGNHPEVIRFMARVGNAISDDKPAGDGGGSGTTADPAYVLFPNDKPTR